MNIESTTGTNLRTMSYTEAKNFNSMSYDERMIATSGLETETIIGMVGQAGIKSHELTAKIILINDEKVIYSAYSKCGAQRSDSRASVSNAKEINCSKCLAKK